MFTLEPLNPNIISNHSVLNKVSGPQFADEYQYYHGLVVGIVFNTLNTRQIHKQTPSLTYTYTYTRNHVTTYTHTHTHTWVNTL